MSALPPLLFLPHSSHNNNGKSTATTKKEEDFAVLYDEFERQENAKRLLESKQKAEIGPIYEQNPYRAKKRQERLQEIVQLRQNDVLNFEFWNSTDYSDTPLPSADTMFENLREIVRVPYGRGNVPYEKLPTFPSDWDFFSSEQNRNDQEAVLETAYETYVAANTESRAVATWTEEDEGRGAPYKEAESILLVLAGLRYDQRVAPRGWMHELYDLVVGAPRCPTMMSFVSTVRHEWQTPFSWFKTLNQNRIKKGDSVILPTFMSTSNSDVYSHYDRHGYFSRFAEFDDPPPESNCCVIQVVVCKGVPMLPISKFDAIGGHAHGTEILLPPGVELIYLGIESLEIDDDHTVLLESYVVRVRDYSGRFDVAGTRTAGPGAASSSDAR